MAPGLVSNLLNGTHDGYRIANASNRYELYPDPPVFLDIGNITDGDVRALVLVYFIMSLGVE